MTRAKRWMYVAGISLFATPALLSAESSDEAAEAVARLRAELPQAQLYYGGPRISRIYGQPLSSGASPVDSAEKFRASYADVFGALPTDLQPHSLLEDQRPTQGVKFNPDTGAFTFTLVYYTQYHQDLEVFRSDLRVLVRNEPGYPVVLAASALRDLGDFQAPAELAAGVKTDAFLQAKYAVAQENALNASPDLRNFTAARPIIWAGVDEMVVTPKVAFVFEADDAPVVNGVADEKWLYVADAQTGEILYQEDKILELDVVGNVSGLATEGVGAEQCEEEAPMAMPYARVSIGGTVVFADVNGDFVVPNAGTANVNVVSGPRGQYFRVRNQPDSTDTTITLNVNPADPADFLHNPANTEFRRAEVNAYIHANVIRDFVLNVNPDYPTIGGQTEYSITVNEGANTFCPGNAQYQGNNLRFCASSATRPNTAWNSVVYHEYGHHLVSTGGSGQGAYGEGMGDISSLLILDDPGTGYGFFGPGTCAEPLRTADNDCQYLASGCSTCGSAVHACGNLISGTVWDIRNALLVTNPTDYREIIADLAINSILLHSGTTINAAIAIDFLTLDDNDSNINNGTPHFQQICSGFSAHGMSCPQLDPVGFSYPAGLPDLVAPNQTATVAVNALSLSDSPLPGTGTISYRIGSSGGFTTVPMNELSANVYEALLPAAGCPLTIEYYFSVQAASAGVVTDPSGAPASVYRAVAANGTITEALYNFESNPGWTVSSTASDGGWDLNPAVPVSGCNRGNPQGDYDGSGQCWMTDNSAASSCNSDVDNGTTTLTSQVFDLSGLVNPQVAYARWYSNNTGDNPETDTLRVEISTNAGASWTALEVVGPTLTSPNPEVGGGWVYKTYPIPNAAQFRIRFIADDVGLQSVVEAAIDAFEIYDFDCTTTALPGDMNCDGVVSVGDIAGFVLAVTDPSGYAASFPDCDIQNADINGDTFITVADIGPFVALLTQ